MSTIRDEYTKKYVRFSDAVIVPKEQNPVPQMKHDSVRLRSDAAFGDLGIEMNWAFIDEPVDMFPGAVENAHERYMIIMGGDTTNILELGGKIEVDIGSEKDDLHTFTFEEAVAIHVEEGLFYDVRVIGIADPAKPIFFNETVFGVYGENGEKGVRSELCGKKTTKEDFKQCFQLQDKIWAKHHPHHEVVYPSITILSPMFGGKTQLRRSWMAVSDPFAMEIKSHYHEFNQYLSFCGTDPDHMEDLGGTIEFTIGETPDVLEKYTCDKACQFFVKEKLYHSPLVFTKVNDVKKPILFCETSLTDNYGRSAEIGDTNEKSEFELFAEKLKAEHQVP